MAVFKRTHPTIYDIPHEGSLADYKTRIPDAGRRRHSSWGIDFDTRAVTLGMKIEDHWEPQIREMHRANQQQMKARLATEYGEHALDEKIENFLAIDTKPMSVLSYHNAYFARYVTPM